LTGWSVPSALSAIPAAFPACRVRESLGTGQALLSNSQTLVGYQHRFSHKFKTQHHMGYYEESNSIPPPKRMGHKLLIYNTGDKNRYV